MGYTQDTITLAAQVGNPNVSLDCSLSVSPTCNLEANPSRKTSKLPLLLSLALPPPWFRHQQSPPCGAPSLPSFVRLTVLQMEQLVCSFFFNVKSVYVTPVFKKPSHGGFPRGAVVKNLPANAGDTVSSPGLGRYHMPWSN